MQAGERSSRGKPVASVMRSSARSMLGGLFDSWQAIVSNAGAVYGMALNRDSVIKQTN